MKAESRRDDEKQSFKEQRLVHKGRRISLVSNTYEKNAQPWFQTDIVLHPGAVALLPVTENGEILLIRQWRRAIETILLELPAGTLEEGESPEECAERELQEEIGLKPSSLTSLGTIVATPGFCTERIHLFLAQGLKESPLVAEDTDGIDVVAFTLEKALALVSSGDIHDSKTLAALLLYQMKLNPNRIR